MRILKGKAAEAYVTQLEGRGSRFDQVEPAVEQIVGDVRRSGDRALRKYARKFDGRDLDKGLRVTKAEMRAAWKSAPQELQSALELASSRIRQFCELQKPGEWRRSCDGVSMGQLVRPLNSVGCYVPGGRFPLVSTLLMTVIPAQVAGVKKICLVSPRPGPEMLAAARML